MKRVIAIALLSVLAVGQAYADWDPELEAQEQREREAAARERAAREAEAQRIHQEAMAKAHAQDMARKREYLGAEANGKSEAEVNRLYDAKQAAKKAEANQLWEEGMRKVKSPEARASTEAVTGYTMEEMSNMSDAELEALTREMEKKYGGGH